MRAIAYCRVSTQEQGRDGLGADAQRAKVTEACSARGWELVDVATDVASGKSTNRRPAFQAALERLDAGEADALVVSKLDRLSRSMLDFATLMERARSNHWTIVALDLGVDTSTPSGEMLAGVIALFAQYERRLIGERTKDALAQAKERGIKVGRPGGGVTSPIPLEVRERMLAMRYSDRLSFAEIARRLDAGDVPTVTGSRWSPEVVRRICLREG
jgi:DNA invertase Pin-like site-specific DNA recombinase